MPRGDLRLEFSPPDRGIRTDLPRHKVSDGYLVDGKNVICRDGIVRSRPGMTPLVSAAPSTNRVMGGIFYEDHTQTARTVIGTTGGFHLYNGTAWSDITGTATLTGGTSDQVRFVPFQIGGSTQLIAVNDKDTPKVYTGSGTFAELGGSPPIAKDVTVAFQRVVLMNLTVAGTRRGSSLLPSGFQTATVWDLTNNQVNLPDTNDTIVGGRALNDQVFVVYKDRSQWVGIGAGLIFPFIFELKAQQPGPVSPSAVVSVEDVHYYLGQDGDVYRFDGNRCVSVGGWAKRLIQQDLDFSLRARAFGFYDRQNREIMWFWPSYLTPNTTSGIVYRIAYEDVPPAFSPLFQSSFILTAGWDWRAQSTSKWSDLSGTWSSLGLTYPTWSSFPNSAAFGVVIGRSTGQVYTFGSTATDDGTGFDVTWEFPLRPVGGVGQNVLVDEIESFFKQTPTPQLVTIFLITSDTLATGGTKSTPQSIDLSTGQKLQIRFAGTLNRYVTVRYEAGNLLGPLEYRGGVLYAYSRGES